MATISKTDGIEVIVHQAYTHPDTILSAAQDVGTKLSATIVMYQGFNQSAANTNPGEFFVQVSGEDSASATMTWATVARFACNAGTPDTYGISSVTAKDFTMDATPTNFTAGDLLYVHDASTEIDSEWHFCESIHTTTHVNVIDTPVTTFDSADAMYNDASIFTCQLDLTSIEQVRVLYSHEGTTGADGAIYVTMVTGDSIA